MSVPVCLQLREITGHCFMEMHRKIISKEIDNIPTGIDDRVHECVGLLKELIWEQSVSGTRALSASTFILAKDFDSNFLDFMQLFVDYFYQKYDTCDHPSLISHFSFTVKCFAWQTDSTPDESPFEDIE